MCFQCIFKIIFFKQNRRKLKLKKRKISKYLEGFYYQVKLNWFEKWLLQSIFFCLAGFSSWGKCKLHLPQKYCIFPNHIIKHLCKIWKHIQMKPVIFWKSLICQERIHIQLNHHHQMHHRFDELYKEIHKCKKFTTEYEKKLLSSQSNISDNDDEKRKIKHQQIQGKWDSH